MTRKIEQVNGERLMGQIEVNPDTGTRTINTACPTFNEMTLEERVWVFYDIIDQEEMWAYFDAYLEYRDKKKKKTNPLKPTPTKTTLDAMKKQLRVNHNAITTTLDILVKWLENGEFELNRKFALKRFLDYWSEVLGMPTLSNNYYQRHESRKFNLERYLDK